MFLDKILDQRRKRLLDEKRALPLEELKKRMKSSTFPATLDFETALHVKGAVAVIGEVKKASPSKGLIRPDFDPVAIAQAYERAGVSAVSVLTEQDNFQGSPEYLKSIRQSVRIPLLRKDFIVDEYQVYEARYLGADAVLLITAALMDHELRRLLALARELGLHALTEVHTEKELSRALDAGARIIGINNRNLATFAVSLDVTRELAQKIPEGKTIVSESGIKTRDDLMLLRDLGVHAALIGEHFMKQPDVENAVRALSSRGINPAAGKGRFGEFGGQYAPETLMNALIELDGAYASARTDASFLRDLDFYYREYAGRPSRLYYAERLTRELGGAKIYLKREDLNHTGSHKINNVLGQALLARRMGKKRVIAETGAGQHGVATATAAALFGMECDVYMGEVDTQRQALNVFRMKLLGARVHPVTTGTATLKDAVNEAFREWTGRISDTFYVLGSVMGPHPYPTIVRDFQAIIGREVRAQMMEKEARLPDMLVACVGGGSNAMGLFYDFLNDPQVELIGVEAGGEGVDTERHAATMTKGSIGVLHGMKSYFLQDKEGQIMPVHSISAGLDYPGIGPEHAFLHKSGRAQYVPITDAESVHAFQVLSRTEGIIPAIESAHAVAHVLKIAPEMPKDKIIVINLSGRGDKDVQSVAKYMGEEIHE